MPSTRNFQDIVDRLRQDPERARRMDALKAEYEAEQRAYQLSELRRALGLTQVELAVLIGRSQTTVSQLENGETALSIDTLRSIVTQLGGTIEITAVFDDQRIPIDA
jgi:DNA-binding XRE family transcriptional regulator